MKEPDGKIVLKLTDRIAFPDKCIYCGRDNPEGTVPLSPREDDTQSQDRMILFAVPACTACSYSHAARERQISNIVCALFLVLMTVVGSLILKSYYSLIIISLVILAITIMYSLDAFRQTKPLVTIESVENSHVTFHSPSREYIDGLLELNRELKDEECESGAL